MKMGKNGPLKRYMILLTDKGILEVFDSHSHKKFSLPTKFSYFEEILNVDLSFVARF